MISRGKFIVLEGLDRSGKSSVTKFLCQWFADKNLPVQSIGFPDRTTPVGKMINQFLNSKTEICQEAIHLLFSANRWENMSKINSTIQSGRSVVCDRYWYSGVAYSMAKGMNQQWCSYPDKGLLEPDLVIYLSADPQVLSKRAHYGQQRFQKLQFQRKVKESYGRLFDSMKKTNIFNVEVNQKSLEEVQQQVRQIVVKNLNLQ